MPALPKLYRWLLKLYPARFREEYQAPMERQFRDEYREARGYAGRGRLWTRTMLDVAGTAPRECVRELKQDLTYSLRLYRSRSLSAIFAVVALGFAIGTSTAVFSVLNALLLRSLPFSDPARLVDLRMSPIGAGAGRKAFFEWVGRSPYLESAAAFSTSEMNLTAGSHDALRVKVAETSANFFDVLGTKPIAGRTFASTEDVPGQSTVAVISYGLWQQLFGGVPTVAGASLRLNGAAFTVIGVAPPRFDYPETTGIWVPSMFEYERVPRHGAFFIQQIGRLKPAIALAQAQSLFDAEVLRAYPERAGLTGTDRARIIPLRDQLAGSVRQAAWILAGLIFLVLLTACANIAQLLLSRTTERRQELAIRAALGASRARLVQQLVTEATVLTVAGAALGILVAQWAVQAASAVAPAQLATQSYNILDWRVLGFAALLALLTGLIFGVLPAVLLGRLHPSEHTMRIKAAAPDIATRRMRVALMASQAGLTFTLVTSSVAMGRSFLQLLYADLGLRTANVVTLNVSLQGTKYRKAPAQWQYYSDALDRLRAIPGVQTAAAVGYLPLARQLYIAADSVKLDSGQTVSQVVFNGVTPDYFRTIGTALIAGRDFAIGEPRRSERAVIVNEAFAQAASLGTSALGRRITTSWSKAPYVIVGMVATTRFDGPGFPGHPQIFWPVEEEPPVTLTLVAKVRGEAPKLLRACIDAVRAVDREVPIYDAKTLEDRLAEVIARPKFYTTATAFLAVLAVLLAAVGTYGAAAYAVAQRKHEMGLRMALGASHPMVRSMVVRESLLPIACGMTAGVAGALATGRYLEYLVINARPVDLWTCAAGAAFLLLAGFTAAWTATGQVLDIAPADALRAE